jgi:catechol 2,3-dioxygenase-like lactoylglutathione lyase family enzyme
MRHHLLVHALALLLAAATGFAAGQSTAPEPRITGIGGVFFKSKHPKELSAWYGKHFGFVPRPNVGVVFEWREKDRDSPGKTAWSVFPDSSKYFEPTNADFMIDYRVDDLDGFCAKLEAEGVKIESRQAAAYGKFAWLRDSDGNKVELWEPPK